MFLLNLDRYSQSIVEIRDEKFHAFEFNELLDIGYSNHLILRHDLRGFYYNHISTEVDRNSRSAKPISFDELIEIVYENKKSVSDTINKIFL
ncbi:hypothetical protein BKP35_12140 [Anaerobacillus arseniciselenatis]|uniref:Uncharacterized protein n=1 Tax=Anaerobacillus arseniciselenatis TaxID=85682 RepID=A0A1S2LGJ0_9BACI|nr:hypothetical protein BKP35_12140 [Anaerobacillus arseniciselenatis]